jgi:uncharacterized protein (DUF2141 family)
MIVKSSEWPTPENEECFILCENSTQVLNAGPRKETTMKRILFAFALAMALSSASLAFPQDKCTVAGDVVYSGASNIYVCLLNSTTFAAALGREKELPPPGFVQIVKANPSGKASFAFKDVPKGEYVVRVFADENNNGKFDADTWGNPLEPVRSYKLAKEGIANWNEQKFEVDKDVTGIVVKLRD